MCACCEKPFRLRDPEKDFAAGGVNLLSEDQRTSEGICIDCLKKMVRRVKKQN